MNIDPSQKSESKFVYSVTMSNFMSDVIDASRTTPILVDFWADWCQPCKQLSPILEKLVTKAGGTIKLAMINADQNPEIAAQLRIQSLPTVLLFKEGQPVDGFAGMMPESEVAAFIDKATADQQKIGDDAEIIEHGFAMLETGDALAAVEIFGAIAQRDPSNADALAGLIQAYVTIDRLGEAEQILHTIPKDKHESLHVKKAITLLELAKQGNEAGNIDDLKKRLEKDPNDPEALFNLAIAYQAHRDLEAASEMLLKSIKADREWNEGAARQQLIKLFDVAGQTSPFTIATRRKLSSLLFS